MCVDDVTATLDLALSARALITSLWRTGQGLSDNGSGGLAKWLEDKGMSMYAGRRIIPRRRERSSAAPDKNRILLEN
jgi:hypothetical protein